MTPERKAEIARLVTGWRGVVDREVRELLAECLAAIPDVPAGSVAVVVPMRSVDAFERAEKDVEHICSIYGDGTANFPDRKRLAIQQGHATALILARAVLAAPKAKGGT